MTDQVFIIAEARVNHDGSLDDALRRVDVAAAAGADAVRFQTSSLAAVRPLTDGRPFDPDNPTAKRPADELSPMAVWRLLGRSSSRAPAADEAIET